MIRIRYILLEIIPAIIQAILFTLGIFIDKISRVISIDKARIQPPPQILSGIGAEYIQGVHQEENGYLIILDVERLFDPKELKQLGNISY